MTLIPAKITQDPLTQHQGESFGPNRIAWRISLRCSDSISSPRTGVEAILTELGPENQNWRYERSSYRRVGLDGLVDRAGFIGRRAGSWICLLVSPRSSQRPAGFPFRRALPWPPSVECGAAGPASWASFYRNHNSSPSRFIASEEGLSAADTSTTRPRPAFAVRFEHPVIH